MLTFDDLHIGSGDLHLLLPLSQTVLLKQCSKTIHTYIYFVIILLCFIYRSVLCSCLWVTSQTHMDILVHCLSGESQVKGQGQAPDLRV